MAEIQYLLNPSHITTPGAHTAEVITNVPSGSISAVTVQNALNEIGNRNYAGSSSFSGAANSAVKLETARTLTIGATGKTFDGSANVTWTLSEIGAVSQEVGTCTPGFSAATAPTGVTYSNTPVGKYVKTGVSCTIEFWILMTSKGTGGSGNALFTNLPFTAYNSSKSIQWKGPVGFIFDLTDSTDSYKLVWGVRDSNTSVYLGRNGGGYYITQWSDLTNTTIAYGSLTYRTAS